MPIAIIFAFRSFTEQDKQLSARQTCQQDKLVSTMSAPGRPTHQIWVLRFLDCPRFFPCFSNLSQHPSQPPLSRIEKTSNLQLSQHIDCTTSPSGEMVWKSCRIMTTLILRTSFRTEAEEEQMDDSSQWYTHDIHISSFYNKSIWVAKTRNIHSSSGALGKF